MNAPEQPQPPPTLAQDIATLRHELDTLHDLTALDGGEGWRLDMSEAREALERIVGALRDCGRIAR
jgi:hypothetical protein